MADPTTGKLDYCADCGTHRIEWTFGVVFHPTCYHWRFHDEEYLWGIREYTYKGTVMVRESPRARRPRPPHEPGMVVERSFPGCC